MAFVTGSNRPQPPGQPPPTACRITSGAASEVPSLVMHPCPMPVTQGRLLITLERCTENFGDQLMMWCYCKVCARPLRGARPTPRCLCFVPVPWAPAPGPRVCVGPCRAACAVPSPPPPHSLCRARSSARMYCAPPTPVRRPLLRRAGSDIVSMCRALQIRMWVGAATAFGGPGVPSAHGSALRLHPPSPRRLSHCSVSRVYRRPDAVRSCACPWAPAFEAAVPAAAWT